MTDKCKHCGDSGYVLVVRIGITHGCCGKPLRSGECCGNAVPEPYPYHELEPCGCDAAFGEKMIGEQS